MSDNSMSDDVSSLADPELGPPPTASTEGVASAKPWNRRKLLVLSVIAVAVVALLCVAVAIPVSNARKKGRRAAGQQSSALSAAMGQDDSSAAAAAAADADEDSDAAPDGTTIEGLSVGGGNAGAGDTPSEAVGEEHGTGGSGGDTSKTEDLHMLEGVNEMAEVWNGTNNTTHPVVAGEGGEVNGTTTTTTTNPDDETVQSNPTTATFEDGEPNVIVDGGDADEEPATGGDGTTTTPAEADGEIAADEDDLSGGDTNGTNVITDVPVGDEVGTDAETEKNVSDAIDGGNAGQVKADTNATATDDVGDTTVENATNGTLQVDSGFVDDPELQQPPSIAARSYRFDVKLRPFSPAVMTPYPGCTQLKRDVEDALKLLADDYIERNLDRDCRHYYDVYMGNDVPMMTMTRAGAPVAMEASSVADAAAAPAGAGAAAADAGTSPGGGEDSYGTNNQVDGVQESDVVKSDGTYIFTAYGSELIMMDARDLTILDRITVPDPIPTSKIVQRGDQDEDDGDISLFAAKSIRPAIGIMPPVHRDPPRRTIKSLLLDAETKHVTAITHYESYDYYHSYENTRIVTGGVTTSFVYAYGGGDEKKLESRGYVDVPGRFSSARSMKRRAHLITSANINTYGFTAQLNRCSTDFRDLYKKTSNPDGEEFVNDGELYREAAFAKASSIVSDYAERIVNELGLLSGDGCDRVVRLSSMSGDEEEEEDEMGDRFDDEEDEKTAAASSRRRRKLDLTDGRGILNGFVRITSFDTTGTDGVIDPASALLGGGEIGGLSVAGAFVPTSGAAETYANEDVIVVAGRGYRSDPSDGGSSWSQYTSLMSFDVRDGTAATQGAVGEVRGYLLNQFSMDHHDGLLRVATTNRAKWAYVRDERTGERRWRTVSESSSQVTTLRLPSGGTTGSGGRMEHVGYLGNLGVTERITSCRFVRDRAYVVTFRLKDPLYVIDMDPSGDGSDNHPKVLGELNITGFSSYIHPIGENDEYLLTVGQEADPETGRSTGMKISLFDVSDATDPREVQKYVMNNGGDGNRGYSSSAAQWDHHAFRYLDLSKKLILPVSSYRYQSEDNFDGFVVYDVDAALGIEPVGTVTHADHDVINSRRRYCFGRARLPPRSMVFGGDRLVTFKGHSVRVSRGLTGELRRGPMMNLDEGRDESNGDECYGYFFR